MRLRPTILPVLVLAASSSACARSHRLLPSDSVDDDPTHEAEDAAVSSAPDAAVDDPAERDVVWVFSRIEDRLAIIGVRLSDGNVVSVRRDIPHAAGDVEYARAYGLDVVHFEFADGRVSVDAFGTPWVSVDAADPGHRIEVRTSDAGDLVWTAVHRFGSPSLVRAQAARVQQEHTGDSADVLTSVAPFYRYEGAGEAADHAPKFGRFVGDRLLFVEGQELYAARSDGAASDPRLIVPNAAYVPAAFDTSLVVGAPDGKQVWVDYDGTALAPEGFRADIAVRGDYQLVDQGVWQLRDRQVAFLLTLPDGVSLDDLVTTVPATPSHGARALVADGRPTLTLLDGGHVRASYAPPSVDCQENTPSATAQVLGHTDLGADDLTVLMAVGHSCHGAEEGLGAGVSLDVWRYDARAGRGQGTRLFAAHTYPPGGFHLSDSGNYAWAVTDEGNLVRIDTRSAETTTLDLTADVLFWPVSR